MAPEAAPAPVVPSRETAIATAPAASRQHYLLISLALLIALVAAGGLFYLQSKDDSAPAPATAATQAATILRGQDAASMTVSYFDQNGLDVTGDLRVAAGGAVSGTLTQAGGGKADFAASGDNAAVRGDQAWWARRDPTRATILQDDWVRPEAFAFPIDGTALQPEALAAIADWVRDGGTVVTDATKVAGIPVVGMRREGWTVLFAAERPHRLVWFGGPLQGRTPITAPQGFTRPAAPTPPYVNVLVAANAASESQIVPPANPPLQDRVAVKRPAFKVTANVGTCLTPTCSWTVTVTNTGTAAGTASVIASVSPGMPKTVVKSLGKLQPGDKATTGRMSFPNPAKTDSNVTADYWAQVFCPELHGTNPKAMRRLQESGVMLTQSDLLSKLDPAQTQTALLALDGMREAPKFKADKAVAMVEDAVTAGMLPEIGELVGSGRLTNPEILYEKLPILIFEYDTAVEGQKAVGSRRQLQIAAQVLREDPAAKVTLGAGITVSGAQNRTIAVRTVSGDTVGANLSGAIEELAPVRGRRVVVLYVEPSAGVLYVGGREVFDGYFGELCSKVDEVLVINQAGAQSWTPAC